MHRTNQDRLGFDLGSASCQVGGPRGSAAVGALIAATFTGSPTQRASRPSPARARDLRSQRN